MMATYMVDRKGLRGLRDLQVLLVQMALLP
jgi:hypothetical protein